MNRNGSSSIIALGLLLLISTLGISLFMILETTMKIELRYNDDFRKEKLIDTEASAIINELFNDKTPESDSMFDAVWDLISAKKNGYEIDLIDISSKINPNFLSKYMFINTEFKELFKNSHTPDELQQYLEEKGLFPNIPESFKDYFLKEDIDKFFTSYGYANLNIAEPVSLRKLYVDRTNNKSGGDSFENKIENLRVDKKILKTEELQQFFGADFEKLFPIINTEPVYNANFIDAYILENILTYKTANYVLENHSAASGEIQTRREKRELTPADIKAIIGESEKRLIFFQYLGTLTWFWSLTIKIENMKIEYIIARIPKSQNTDKLKYQIVYKRIL